MFKILKSKKLIVFITILLFAGSLFAGKDSINFFNELDNYVEKVRSLWKVPGIAVGIIKDGKLVYAKGYGVRQKGKPERVTPKTIFGIASNTKAFTAAALAILVDEGKLN